MAVFMSSSIPRDFCKPMKLPHLSPPRCFLTHSIMAARVNGEHILYDVFIRAEWSLEGEILVSVYLL